MISKWIKSLFEKEEFNMEEFSDNLDEILERKLKIIYKSDSYKRVKKEVYEDYEEFKEEHKDMIGKIFHSDEMGYFKIIRVKEPWFLKSPILIDSANFKWRFQEEFEVQVFDGYLEDLGLEHIESDCYETTKEGMEKSLKDFANQDNQENK